MQTNDIKSKVENANERQQQNEFQTDRQTAFNRVRSLIFERCSINFELMSSKIEHDTSTSS